jgi:predicted nucleotidyltransferase
MINKIRQFLNSIEQDEKVQILYACESGSRAWGFASIDSDYDVRFIYLRPKEYYLSINIDQEPDVIELPIHSGLDVNGWDLRKALQLFQRSNPPLLEWLGSPIVYLEKYSVAARMRELTKICYSPIACQYHYYKMAKGNYREYLQGEQVWVKKYFYVLRPVLAVIWLERGMGVVPTEFIRLVEGAVESEQVKEAIHALLIEKQTGNELDYGHRIPAISDFLEQELARMEAGEFERRIGQCPVEKLNELFRNALAEVWN